MSKVQNKYFLVAVTQCMLNGEGDTPASGHYFKMCYNRFMDIVTETKRRCCKAPPDTKLVI